jgi:NAD+-dependent secondary alcohol dehydrogenase Adh1
MVIGIGGLGHVGVQILRALSASTIIAVDPSPAARQLATNCGATSSAAPDEVAAILAEATQGRGADVVIDFVGEDSSIPLAFESTAAGGHYILVGYGGEITIPAVELISTERRIIGCQVGTHAELTELIELVRLGAVSLETTHVPLTEINGAIHDLHDGRITGRVVITPGS